MSLGALLAKPPPVSFTSLRTGRGVEMPYMPESLTERMSVSYARQKPLGLSHEVLQYIGTTNYTLPGLTFPLRATTVREMERIQDIRRFFMSLAVPPGGVDTVAQGAPDRILFMWPRLIVMTFVLTEFTLTHQKFNIEGESNIMKLVISLEEIRDARLLADDVRELGTIRSPDVFGADDAAT